MPEDTTDATLRSILNQSFAGIYIVGTDSTFVYVNARLADLFGYPAAELLGHSFLEYVDPAEVAMRRARFDDAVAGNKQSVQTIGAFRRRDGSRIELLTQSTLATYGGRPAVIGLSVDVTERMRGERALERLNRTLKMLSEANTALVRAKNEADLLRDMCSVAVAGGGYVTAWVGMAIHDDAKSVELVAHTGAAREYIGGAHTSWADTELGRGPTGAAIRTGKPVINHDYQTNPVMLPWRTAAAAHGVKSSIAIPLRGEDGVFGALALYAKDADAFDPEEVELLAQLGSDISYGVVALRNRAALRDEEERSRRHTERLEALWRIINNLSLKDDELWTAMLEQAAAAIRPGQPYVGGLGRIEDTEIVYEAVAATKEYLALRGSMADFAVDRSVPLAGSAAEAILNQGGNTQSWDDLRAAFPGSSFQRTGTQSGIFTAFRAGGSTYVLWFVAPAKTGAWSPQDHAFVEVLASFFLKNIQERWQSARLMYHQTHDVLTGLLNRSQFRSQARMASLQTETYAVISLDLSGFGEINETYGSMIGDALLVEVAASFFERAAPGEITGRIGGDVFAVYIPHPQSKELVRDRALHFMERFRQPFSTGDRDGKEFIALSASLGIAIAPEHGSNVDQIISHSNVAVTAAKTRGRGTVLFYESGMEGDAQRNARLHNELNAALAREELVLYYQPHVNVVTGDVTGCEALIRWQHPERGILAPAEFIPFAEREGLISEIDVWVFRHAVTAAREFGARWPGFRLYFNLSGRQAGDPMLIKALAREARAGLRLDNVGIEITESDVMRDFEATRHVCRALRRLGVRVAVDDFGTGFSSLSSLKRLPVDVIKIDRSFVSGILTDPHDEALVETIVQMTKLFDCDALAEGVEQQGEMDWLASHACRLAQGYLIARPLPHTAFRDWVDARSG